MRIFSIHNSAVHCPFFFYAEAKAFFSTPDFTGLNVAMIHVILTRGPTLNCTGGQKVGFYVVAKCMKTFQGRV